MHCLWDDIPNAPALHCSPCRHSPCKVLAQHPRDASASPAGVGSGDAGFLRPYLPQVGIEGGSYSPPCRGLCHYEGQQTSWARVPVTTPLLRTFDAVWDVQDTFFQTSDQSGHDMTFVPHERSPFARPSHNTEHANSACISQYLFCKQCVTGHNITYSVVQSSANVLLPLERSFDRLRKGACRRRVSPSLATPCKGRQI